MPTIPQINAAKLDLEPQPYDALTSTMTSDAVGTLHTFLVKFLFENQMTGRYSGLEDKLAAAVGFKAAFLQAVLNNVSGEGSKKAKLQGELEYFTQDTIDNELKLALFSMYEPLPFNNMGTKASEAATAIRNEYNSLRYPFCGGNEFEKTR